jgi:hypothetical protein
MVASTILKGGFSNRTLQYEDVSSMTRTCDSDLVMIHDLCSTTIERDGEVMFSSS